MEPRDIAEIESLGLRAGGKLGIVRRRRGRGFSYVNSSGRPIRDAAVLARLRALAIPPAYTEVRIANNPRAHIQAVGRDDAGRLQYRYHPDWEQLREARKTDRLAVLCGLLPGLRRRLRRDLRRPGAGRDKALAAVVALIDRTHIRVGCADYVHSGRSRGASTLLKKSLDCSGDRIRLDFRGKRRAPIRCEVRAPALARALLEIAALPGRRLFQYRDEKGVLHKVSAPAVNAFLREITGETVTAKDFRMLAATASAAERFCALEPEPGLAMRRRQIAGVMRAVAEDLANTPAVVRKSYVHRRLVEAFESGELARLAQGLEPQRELTRGESLVAALFPPGLIPARAAKSARRQPTLASRFSSRIGNSRTRMPVA